uniref:Immunoglobulin domain-containing protein n=1 Tax=Monopterus albus TaxID=43700 RepID=A0A3Q3K9E5_MONAL
MTCTFSVTEGSDLIQLSGEVGGNVTFHCPFAKEKAIRFFYLQKDTSPILFVNGYYGDNDTGKQYTIERMKLKNTELNLSDRTVYMDGLNISHSGVYECIISYNDKGNTESSKIHLSVTARYSKPTVTMSCNGENLGCLVTCASHGGYPSTKMTWNVAENASNQIWNIVNNSEVPSPDTMMFSSSSTAYFNCSYRKPLNYLSCSVGEISSDMFSVCVSTESPETFSPIVIAAAVCAVVAVITMVGLTVFCKKNGKDREYTCHKVAVLHTFAYSVCTMTRHVKTHISFFGFQE